VRSMAILGKEHYQGHFGSTGGPKRPRQFPRTLRERGIDMQATVIA